MEPQLLIDCSIKPIEDLKSLGFTKKIPKDSITQFRRISSNFFETLAFHLLEQRILTYDPNEFMTFMDKFKSESSQNSDLLLEKYKTEDITNLFIECVNFLENISDLLLNSVSDRDQTVKIMIQTLEDPKTQMLQSLGLFLKMNIINYGEKIRKRSSGFSSDLYSKFITPVNFEKELSLNDILIDMRVICESQAVNLCLIMEDASACTHHSSKGEVILTFMHLNDNYLVLYNEKKQSPDADKRIPLPPSNVDDLMSLNYDEESIPKKYKIDTMHRPCQNGMPAAPSNEMILNSDKENTPKKYQIDSMHRPYQNVVISDMKVDYETQCCLCHNELIDRAFINAICQHKFCYLCLVEKTQKQSSSSICYEARCTKSINSIDVEDYLIEMNFLKETENNQMVSEKIPCLCSKCKNEDLINFSTNFMAPEYFICTKCKDFQCLIHNDSMDICRCFCEKCKQKLDDFPNIKQRFCKICQKTYCLMCMLDKKDCQCFCLACNSRKNKKNIKCEFCEKECVNCHTPYKQDSLILADCGKHFICRCCVIREICYLINGKNERKCGVC